MRQSYDNTVINFSKVNIEAKKLKRRVQELNKSVDILNEENKMLKAKKKHNEDRNTNAIDVLRSSMTSSPVLRNMLASRNYKRASLE